MNDVKDIWQMGVDNVDMVVFDLETTGFDPYKGHNIVEYGALKLRAGQPVDHYFKLVNPGRPIPGEARAVHGISDSDVANCPPADELLPAFLDFAGDAVLIAQNARFDTSFISAAMKRNNLKLPNNPVIDIIGLSKFYLPGLSSNSLANVCRVLGVQNEEAHRAAGDVAAESQVFLTYYEQLKSEETEATVANLYFRAVADKSVEPVVLNSIDWHIAYRLPMDILYSKIPGDNPVPRKVRPMRTFSGKQNGVGYLKALDLSGGENADSNPVEKTFKVANISLPVLEG